MDNVDRPVTVVIVGAGHRSLGYASYGSKNPDKLKVVAVVDPDKIRREKAAKLHNISDEFCFHTVDELLQKTDKPIADAVINGTMDEIHIETAIPLLRAGYDMLLEKPISTNEGDLLKLLKVTRETGRKVMICHVLRYAPFYAEIKKMILNGEIGDIINIQSAEHVSYHHMSVSYVRGKWNSKEKCGSSMLMAKCCHDLDIITWLKSGVEPVEVNSMGGLYQFKEENAPEESGTRCLVDCSIEEDCMYSARKIYLNHPDRWTFYVWSFIEEIENPTIEDKIDSLKTDNPHGRCIWKCDNDVVDHQSVVIRFKDGTTATHNMVGGTARPMRKLHVIGTKGEIKGIMNDEEFIIYAPDTTPGNEYTVKKVNVEVNTEDYGDDHGGGDLRLVEDFVRVMRGKEPSISTTSLEDSIYGHLLGFRADKAMEGKKVVKTSLDRV